VIAHRGRLIAASIRCRSIVIDLAISVERPLLAGCRPWIARDMRHSRGADRRQLSGLTPAGRIRLPRAPDRAYEQRKPTGTCKALQNS